MKAITTYLLLLILGIAIGYLIKPVVNPTICPKMKELVTLQFGHSDIGLITDDEAQLILNATREYIQMKAWSDAPVWEVYAICAMKGLTPKDPQEYEKESIEYFLKDYREGDIPDGYRKFVDKVYEYLTSDEEKLDIKQFEPIK